MFARYLELWELTPDGPPLVTETSRLLPVRFRGEPAMLKIALVEEELRGAGQMAWWSGNGAARVHGREGNALLMERAVGDASLAEMSRSGADDEATRIICEVAGRLHGPERGAPPRLTTLSEWFAPLAPAASVHGGVLARAAATARELLEAPRETVALHGDLHHGNILDFGARGWLAIDPKGLVGERAFDFVNILRNPDADVATAPGRLGRQATVISGAAGVERQRLLRWVMAFCGLSAAWILADGGSPRLDLDIAAIAEAELLRSSAAPL